MARSCEAPGVQLALWRKQSRNCGISKVGKVGLPPLFADARVFAAKERGQARLPNPELIKVEVVITAGRASSKVEREVRSQ